MLHDLMMRDADTALLESYTGEIREVFDYYESLINEYGLVGQSEYRMFIDWYLPKGGNSVVNQDGNSAILTLNYAYTLGNAADIMEWLGYREKASVYRTQARKYAEIVRKLCFDPQKGLYADDPAKTFYDQPTSPGFGSVRIAPQPGQLNRIDATYPSPRGKIGVNLSFGEEKRATGQVTLPEGMYGEFVWNGQTRTLKSGTNEL